MRKFILQSALFVLVCLILLICFHLTIQNLRNDYLKLPENVNKVFLGNSTFEYGINDSRIPNAINFAQNAEPIDITYAKIKLLQKYNNSIDTVFVELDDINLYNDRFASVLSNSIYFDAYDKADWQANLQMYELSRFFSFFAHAYHVIKVRPIVENHFKSHNIECLGVGGYQDLFRNKLDEDIMRFHSETASAKKTKLVPTGVDYYFSKIVDFCAHKNLTIIFLNTPKHKTAWADTTYREYWSEKFPSIRFIDCTQMNLPDSCFADREHLNYRGARLFSDYLTKTLRDE